MLKVFVQFFNVYSSENCRFYCLTPSKGMRRWDETKTLYSLVRALLLHPCHCVSQLLNLSAVSLYTSAIYTWIVNFRCASAILNYPLLNSKVFPLILIQKFIQVWNIFSGQINGLAYIVAKYSYSLAKLICIKMSHITFGLCKQTRKNLVKLNILDMSRVELDFGSAVRTVRE